MTIASKKLPWTELMSRNDLVGGELILHTPQVLYRGRIARIEPREFNFGIDLAWAGYCDLREKEGFTWKKSDACKYGLEKKGQPIELENRHIRITPHNSSHYFILRPEDDATKLEPSDVIGLPADWQRLWALYPLSTFVFFDRKLIRSLLIHEISSVVRQALDDATEKTNLRQFIVSLKKDHTREIFLREYIEKLLQDKNHVCPTVY